MQLHHTGTERYLTHLPFELETSARNDVNDLAELTEDAVESLRSRLQRIGEVRREDRTEGKRRKTSHFEGSDLKRTLTYVPETEDYSCQGVCSAMLRREDAKRRRRKLSMFLCSMRALRYLLGIPTISARGAQMGGRP